MWARIALDEPLGRIRLIGLALGLGAVSFAGFGLLAPEAPPHGDATWEVSITNVTRGQILSPPVVYTHNENMAPLWTLGSPASKELAGVAEDANNPALIAARCLSRRR